MVSVVAGTNLGFTDFRGLPTEAKESNFAAEINKSTIL